jgi:hypothetical protein
MDRTGQCGARAFTFENSYLLPQREDLEGGIGAAAEEDPDGCQECGDQIDHESTHLTLCDTATGESVAWDRKLLI